MKKRIIAGAVFLTLLAALVLRADYVLMPARMNYGAVWHQYLQEPKNSIDVLVIGSSMAYCDIAPAEIYAQSGLKSFVMAGPEQTLSITYFYLKEALKTQDPSVVLLEITGTVYHRYMKYTRANIGYMPAFSGNRLAATLFCAEPELRTGLLFPLFDYHDRFTGPKVLLETRKDDMLDPLAGYTPKTGIKVTPARKERELTVSDEDFRDNLEWLLRIKALCDRKEIRLVLFEVPSCGPLPDDCIEQIQAAVGDSTELLDLNRQFDEIGLNMQTDFLDRLHTNIHGAALVSDALSAYLSSTGAETANAGNNALWNWRMEYFAEKLSEFELPSSDT